MLTGDKAVPFFSHSQLPPALLGEIWQLSDPENAGFLTPQRFGASCRLIGHAQALASTTGEDIKVEWLGQRESPLPSPALPRSLRQGTTR